MQIIFSVIVTLSIAGAFLIGIILVSKPILKKQFSKRWQYYIWLVVIARLLIPIVISPEGFINLVDEKRIEQVNSYLLDRNQEEKLFNVDITSNRKENLVHSNQNVLQDHQEKNIDFWEVMNQLKEECGVIWFIGVVVLFTKKVTTYKNFVKYMKVGWRQITDINMLDELAKMTEKVGIKSPVELYHHPLVISPLIIGFFKPVIVLPSTSLSDVEFRYTILHELVHFKRRDIFYKWLIQLVICIHWFNPLVYIMEKEVEQMCELSCDEVIISRLGRKEQRIYGDTLLNAVIRKKEGYQDELAIMPLYEDKEMMKERLEAIMQYKIKSKTRASILLVCALLLIGSFNLVGVFSLKAQEQEKVEKSKEDIELGGYILGEPIYLIHSEEGLRLIGSGEYTMDKCYMLSEDVIEISDTDWKPIGTKENPFTGSFDGNGCVINGFVDKGEKSIFGYANHAQFHNITLSGTKKLVKNQKELQDRICAKPTECSLEDIFIADNNEEMKTKQAKVNKESVLIKTQTINNEKWYLVENEAQLRALGNGEYGWNQNYKQVADIKVSTDEWKPIGSSDVAFTGKYDGNGFQISGITMANPDTQLAALFGYAENATLCNISLKEYDIEKAGSNLKTVTKGGIVAFAKGGKVDGCEVSSKNESGIN